MGIETILLVLGLIVVIAVGAGAIKAKRRSAGQDTNATPPGKTVARPSSSTDTSARTPPQTHTR